MQQSEPLSILGAVYGKQDVTNVIRSLVQFGSTQIQANPQIFGDSMPGVQKTLVIVYQYGISKPIVLIAKEGDNVTIAPNNNNQHQWVTYQPGEVTILGAAYGLAVVTDKVAQRVQNNSLDIQAENSIFGDTWEGVRKVLTVVYRDANGEAKTAIAEENGKIKIEGNQYQQQQYQYQEQPYYQQVPKILGAAYGKANVTEKVRSIIANGNLKISAENSIFGDSWYGVQKSLVVIYQFGENKPQVGITREGQTLTLSQSNQFSEWALTNNGQIQILGAAYGLADVTNQVVSKVQGSSLLVRATNQAFGDSWHGTGKTLVVVYQDAQGNINTSIVPEGEAIKINAAQPKRASHPGQIPKILGAAYGKADVTEKVRSIVANGDLEIPAKNEILGDSWHGVQKSLVVVYQFGNNRPQVRVTSEHDTLTLDEPNQPSEWYLVNNGQIQILGAAYGLADVTNQVASRVQGSALQVRATNQNFGDSWYGVRKTLVIVYQDTQGNIKTSIAEEDGNMKITAPQQKPKILGAAYGKTNVTDKVRSMVAGGNLQIPAANNIFGDSFYGVQKSLVVVYQFGDAKPRVGIASEHSTLMLPQGNLNFQSFPMDPEQGQILGAAYGLADVTNQVASRIQNSVLDIYANNESLGDSWHGIRKTLVVVSQDPQGNVNTHIVEEGGNLKLNLAPPLIPTILGAVYGKANITDQVRAQVANGRRQIQASNSIYGDSFPNVAKSLVIVYQFGNSPPQVAIAKENQTANLNQQNQSYQWFNPVFGQPCILGAAYGLANVTNKVVQKLQNSILDVRADNGTFGDPWPGTRKTLVVVYQDPQGNINTSIVEEEGNLKISFQQQQNWGGQVNYGGGNFQPQYGNNLQQQPQYNNNPYGQPQYGNNFQQQNNNNNPYNPYGGYPQQQFNNNQQQDGGYGGGFGKQL